jgi:16S rRNA C1402 (ribose-2'-O) methylase RsmI
MGDLQVMSASMDSDPDIALFREDLVILKRDVASLIEHIKGGATNRAQSWLRESEQSVEWIFCLTAARVLVANQEQR